MSQLEFEKIDEDKKPKRGGARKGAGRKKLKNKPLQNHTTRAKVTASKPIHVTYRLVKGLGRLRNKKGFRVFYKSIVKAQKKGLKVIHYSVQSNHLHMIIEARNNETLSRALQSFAISFARQLNGLRGRAGQVFSDRYHMHILKTPTEVRNTIKYVLLNAAKHKRVQYFLDPYSSGAAFDGWDNLGLKERLRDQHHFRDKMLISYIYDLAYLPQSWVLRVGWQKAKVLST